MRVVVVVWGYRGGVGVGALRIPCKLSTYGKFRHTAKEKRAGCKLCT
jgi:hypothetical protein